MELLVLGVAAWNYFTACKGMYKHNLALNNLKSLRYHKKWPTNIEIVKFCYARRRRKLRIKKL